MIVIRNHRVVRADFDRIYADVPEAFAPESEFLR